ncbi:MAG: nucleotidyltransferase [Marinicaulis sp.]|nr:nucleotidyltransferase [Marinicaulis sp.]
MSRQHIDHKDILEFAQDRVNLPQDKARKYREQVRGLRERLERHLDDNPDFALKKMLLSGSLAKGTALRSLNDIDVAVYVSGSDAPHDIAALLEFIADRLVATYPNITSDQISINTYSVTLSFKGTGLDVDIVPILYYGDPDWRGNLISQDDGTFLETSIPLHLEFTRNRKKAQPDHFAQVVRLVKFWAMLRKNENPNFRFKSFMIEMILAHLADNGVSFADYPEALQTVFTFLVKTDLREMIVFSDYYDPATAPACDCDEVKILDPVNKENNVARLYTPTNADLIVTAAMEAGDAIDYALSATTKQETVDAWRDVFGPQF